MFSILSIFAYNRRMRTASYSELRRNLAATIDSVNADHEPVIITRDRGKPAAVLMSIEDYASFEETRYLLKSPRNAERLRESTMKLDGSQGIPHELAECGRRLTERNRRHRRVLPRSPASIPRLVRGPWT